MEFLIHIRENKEIAELATPGLQIEQPQDFLDIMGNAGARMILIRKEQIHEDFFDLKTMFAGEMLQKVSNYGIKLGIIGNYSQHNSGSLRDFIHESNRSGQVLFVETINEAIERFTSK